LILKKEAKAQSQSDISLSISEDRQKD